MSRMNWRRAAQRRRMREQGIMPVHGFVWPPTPKQIGYAEDLARRQKKVVLPENYRTSGEACSDFITEARLFLRQRWKQTPGAPRE